MEKATNVNLKRKPERDFIPMFRDKQIKAARNGTNLGKIAPKIIVNLGRTPSNTNYEPSNSKEKNNLRNRNNYYTSAALNIVNDKMDKSKKWNAANINNVKPIHNVSKPKNHIYDSNILNANPASNPLQNQKNESTEKNILQSTNTIPRIVSLKNPFQAKDQKSNLVESSQLKNININSKNKNQIFLSIEDKTKISNADRFPLNNFNNIDTINNINSISQTSKNYKNRNSYYKINHKNNNNPDSISFLLGENKYAYIDNYEISNDSNVTGMSKLLSHNRNDLNNSHIFYNDNYNENHENNSTYRSKSVKSFNDNNNHNNHKNKENLMIQDDEKKNEILENFSKCNGNVKNLKLLIMEKKTKENNKGISNTQKVEAVEDIHQIVKKTTMHIEKIENFDSISKRRSLSLQNGVCKMNDSSIMNNNNNISNPNYVLNLQKEMNKNITLTIPKFSSCISETEKHSNFKFLIKNNNPRMDSPCKKINFESLLTNNKSKAVSIKEIYNKLPTQNNIQLTCSEEKNVNTDIDKENKNSNTDFHLNSGKADDNSMDICSAETSNLITANFNHDNCELKEIKQNEQTSPIYSKKQNYNNINLVTIKEESEMTVEKTNFKKPFRIINEKKNLMDKLQECYSCIDINSLEEKIIPNTILKNYCKAYENNNNNFNFEYPESEKQEKNYPYTEMKQNSNHIIIKDNEDSIASLLEKEMKCSLQENLNESDLFKENSVDIEKIQVENKDHVKINNNVVCYNNNNDDNVNNNYFDSDKNQEQEFEFFCKKMTKCCEENLINFPVSTKDKICKINEQLQIQQNEQFSNVYEINKYTQQKINIVESANNFLIANVSRQMTNNSKSGNKYILMPENINNFELKNALILFEEQNPDLKRLTTEELFAENKLPEFYKNYLKIKNENNDLHNSIIIKKNDIEQLRENYRNIQTLKANYEHSLKEAIEEINSGEMRRRRLHNYIQELRGNIRVYVRLKPSTNDGSFQDFLDGANFKSYIRFPDKSYLGKNEKDNFITCLELLPMSNIPNRDSKLRKSFEVTNQSNYNVNNSINNNLNNSMGNQSFFNIINVNPPTNNNSAYYNFDRVFPEWNSQEEIFKEIHPFIQSALDGENVSIFAYGATGSGKTYTMQGPCNAISERNFSNNTNTNNNNSSTIRIVNELSGIVPRTAEFIFDEIKRLEKINVNQKIIFSAFEIYNEKLYDLFDKNPNKNNLSFYTEPNTNNIIVKDLIWKEIKSKMDIVNLTQEASETRVTDSTIYNESSSRSHAIYQLKIEFTNKFNKQINGLINFVDLAGSEKSSYNLSDKNEEEIQLNKKLQNDANFINSSLLNLGKIIRILADKKSSKMGIPYRDSKLTHVLQNSLKVSSKTAVIITLSNNPKAYYSNKNSLDFALKCMIAC